MLRVAVPGDEARIEAFLAGHAASSMFLRSNLAECGLMPSDNPRSTVFWLYEPEGRIAGVFGRTRAGNLMAQAPGAGVETWKDWASRLNGQEMLSVTGAAAQMALAVPALGIASGELGINRVEPLYRLDLTRVNEAAMTGGALRLPREADRDLLIRWFRDYEVEALGTPAGERLEAISRTRTDAAIAGGTTRLLLVGEVPVAMTALNARLPDVVQVGGVYTPPENRGRGHARTAVALHMIELRGQGVKEAILFASGEPASRAYEAIGFERIGEYTVAVLKTPRVIGRMDELSAS